MIVRTLLIPMCILVLVFSATVAEAQDHREHSLPDVSTNSPDDSQEPTRYACPMHPEIEEEAPGRCRICQMELVDTGQLHPPKGPHGGRLHKLNDLELEFLIETTGLRIYAFNGEGEPIDLRHATGIAELAVDGQTRRYRYDLYPEDDSADAGLASAVDLSRLVGKQVDARLQLRGVGESLRRLPPTMVSLAVEPTERERVAAAIEAQGICPVTEKPLGSMGEPVAVDVLGSTVYVCCAGCRVPLQQNPTDFLPLKPRLQFSPATADDADAIAAQKRCPVMDEPLGSMGTPIKVTGLEQTVYLCCQGCVKRFQADPQKFFERLSP